MMSTVFRLAITDVGGNIVIHFPAGGRVEKDLVDLVVDGCKKEFVFKKNAERKIRHGVEAAMLDFKKQTVALL